MVFFHKASSCDDGIFALQLLHSTSLLDIMAACTYPLRMSDCIGNFASLLYPHSRRRSDFKSGSSQYPRCINDPEPDMIFSVVSVESEDICLNADASGNTHLLPFSTVTP